MIWTCLFAGVLAAASPQVEVRTLDGRAETGTLVKLDVAGLSLQTARGPVAIPSERLLGVTWPSAPAAASPPPGVAVELVDGSELSGTDLTISGEQAKLLRPGGPLGLPAKEIRSVRLQPPTEALAAEWARLRQQPLTSDLLVTRQDDHLDYHRGMLGELGAERIDFTTEGDVLHVARSKVFGLLYHRPAGRQLPATLCRLTDAGGSRWALAELSLGPSGLAVKTPSGVAATLPVEQLGRLDFSEGKVLFLAELEPSAVRFTPYFGTAEESASRARFYAPRRDQGLEGGPIELGGKPYTKGLALHSRTELEYVLPAPFGRFKALVGIDDRLRPRGDVRLVLSGDGRPLVEESIKGTDPPRAIDVDLTGVRRLTILVDFGGDLDVGDYLDLAEARIVK